MCVQRFIVIVMISERKKTFHQFFFGIFDRKKGNLALVGFLHKNYYNALTLFIALCVLTGL